MDTDLHKIKLSEISNFIGEVFIEELKDIIKNNNSKEFWVRSHGMNSRAFSKDVLDVSNYNYATETEIKEAIFIHLSRNSIYHHLPESFFHPITISHSGMSNKEIVSAIKHNRKLEEDNIHFFIPFDTSFFNIHVTLVNRFLNIYTDEKALKNLFNLAYRIIDRDIPLTKEQYYKLFLNICNAEYLKENLPALEELLYTILGYSVKLEYENKLHSESPFYPLGSAQLGYTLGTQGVVVSEFDDICATMTTDFLFEHKIITQHKEIIKMILDFFIFSNRDIKIKYTTNTTNGFLLGQTHLSYNTILKI